MSRRELLAGVPARAVERVGREAVFVGQQVTGLGGMRRPDRVARLEGVVVADDGSGFGQAPGCPVIAAGAAEPGVTRAYMARSTTVTGRR